MNRFTSKIIKPTRFINSFNNSSCKCQYSSSSNNSQSIYPKNKNHLKNLPLPTANSFPKNEKINDYFQFEVVHQSSKSNARVTKITTPHGIIETPNFVPVATIGSIKFVDPVTTRQQNSQLMFVNTYHMIVNADLDTIEKAGGLHNFINYQAPIITDSGGFQVFSMGHPERHNTINEQDDSVTDVNDLVVSQSIEMTKRELKGMSGKKYPGSIESITDDGVIFRSYRTSSIIELGPQSSIQYQKKLGADIIIPFDELPPYHISEEKVRESLHRTHHWEGQSLLEHLKDPRQQAMYSVIHGGVNKEMRRESLEYLTSLPFDGVAIGGSIGKDRDEMNDLLSFLMPLVPRNKPNHLLGIGDLESIIRSVPLGIDTFDSSYPTRSARHGSILLAQSNDRFLITKSEYKSQYDTPLDKSCDCPTCKNYSTAYIHHLYKSNEQIFYTLATQHNLRAMARIMENIRFKIQANEI
ncbi:methionyl-tRNA synthetase beta subunit [Cavenderia fasciculata]|uniref:Methionyl-tRNA synthetase beta subunit n=1 Tax=Cavenderia fasciculata TaxID=261658 RepID=F4PMB2_CACFS|nr:methionyl-tRNA synthetase beta subunit [Cavenderia fasciculata]EGG22762.1 methionyl-tRNA synthetase beta subunit [Cavenderia fasciculata]|eukprot:XP_004360613.1 methionyl-tRNA synthetase beta subunit [Cavenderia fasciculata]